MIRKRLNRFLVGCIVFQQFSVSLASESTSGQRTRGTENWTSAFCKLHQHPFGQKCLILLVDCFSLIQCHFFSEPGPINDHCPFSKSFGIQRNEFGICQTFLFVVFRSTRNVVEHRHRILPVKFSGVSSNLNSKLLTSSLSCNVLNPRKIFHSNSIGSPSILSKFL